jgi:hypothetical protein
MNNSDKVKMMSGDAEQKRQLLDYYMEKIKLGESLEDEDIPIFEFLQKELINRPQVALMSASVFAAGGIEV